MLGVPLGTQGGVGGGPVPREHRPGAVRTTAGGRGGKLTTAERCCPGEGRKSRGNPQRQRKQEILQKSDDTTARTKANPLTWDGLRAKHSQGRGASRQGGGGARGGNPPETGEPGTEGPVPPTTGDVAHGCAALPPTGVAVSKERVAVSKEMAAEAEAGGAARSSAPSTTVTTIRAVALSSARMEQPPAEEPEQPPRAGQRCSVWICSQ